MTFVEALSFLTIPLFFSFVVVELLIARRRRAHVFSLADSIVNLVMAVINRVMVAVWIATEVAILAWFAHMSPYSLPNSVVTALAAIVAVDFAFYWYHRTHHRVRVLWAVHVIHHSSNEFNTITGFRQPWIVLTQTPFWIPLALVGFSPEMIAVGALVNALYSFPLHTQLVSRLPWGLERILNTPSHHRVHHGRNSQYLDRNYGGIVIVWDKVFGTYAHEDEPVDYGLTTRLTTNSPFRIATHELLAIVRDFRRAPTLRRRLSVLRVPPPVERAPNRAAA